MHRRHYLLLSSPDLAAFFVGEQLLPLEDLLLNTQSKQFGGIGEVLGQEE
jgi:hypothetical protein